MGSYPGGTDVRGWTAMRGNKLLSPDSLPCGVPLYFSVTASNTQGLATTVHCTLPTFDRTFPDGWVEDGYR